MVEWKCKYDSVIIDEQVGKNLQFHKTLGYVCPRPIISSVDKRVYATTFYVVVHIKKFFMVSIDYLGINVIVNVARTSRKDNNYARFNLFVPYWNLREMIYSPELTKTKVTLGKFVYGIPDYVMGRTDLEKLFFIRRQCISYGY